MKGSMDQVHRGGPRHSGDDKFYFLCEEDFHDKTIPSTWDATLFKLRGEFANDMVITPFVEVLHYELIIVTVCKVGKSFVLRLS